MESAIFSSELKFAWDEGNITKSEKKHSVTQIEAEEVFFNQPLVVEDSAHSRHERRFWALGRTGGKKSIHVTFTIRKDRLRVISARPMSKKERDIYEKATKI